MRQLGTASRLDSSKLASEGVTPICPVLRPRQQLDRRRRDQRRPEKPLSTVPCGPLARARPLGRLPGDNARAMSPVWATTRPVPARTDEPAFDGVRARRSSCSARSLLGNLDLLLGYFIVLPIHPAADDGLLQGQIQGLTDQPPIPCSAGPRYPDRL